MKLFRIFMGLLCVCVVIFVSALIFKPAFFLFTLASPALGMLSGWVMAAFTVWCAYDAALWGYHYDWGFLSNDS